MADAEREKVDSNEYLFGIAKKKIDEPIFPQSVNEEENLEATKLKLDEKDITQHDIIPDEIEEGKDDFD